MAVHLQNNLDWPSLTVAVINHNGIDVLPATLDALRNADYPDLKVVLADDQSTDDSVAFVAQNYPEVRVLAVKESKHKPSVPRNLALRECDTPYVLLLDNDVAMQPDSLKRLMQVMIERPNTFRVVPRIVDHDNPDRIYIDGGGLSYLGISARSVRGKSVQELPPGKPIASIGSGIILLNRAAALKLNGFDEDYLFGWGEDAELTVRARMLGFEAWTVQDALGLHVEKEHGTHRAEAQFYNRYRLMLINYSMRGLILLTPAIVLFDVMMFTMGLLKGLAPLHMRAVERVVRNWSNIMQQRRFVQQRRAVGDASLLEGTPILITGVLRQSPALLKCAGVASGFFIAYWQLVRHFLGDEPFDYRPRGIEALADDAQLANRERQDVGAAEYTSTAAA